MMCSVAMCYIVLRCAEVSELCMVVLGYAACRHSAEPMNNIACCTALSSYVAQTLFIQGTEWCISS